MITLFCSPGHTETAKEERDQREESEESEESEEREKFDSTMMFRNSWFGENQKRPRIEVPLGQKSEGGNFYDIN